MLQLNEKERYLRQMGMQYWGEQGQEKLKASSVFVAGAGGLGSAVLYYCAAVGIGTIYICDYDTVDITNLNRQILHTINSLGMLKIESAYTALSALNDSITINILNDPIESPSVSEIIARCDLVIDCLDSFASRLALNRYAVQAKIPMIHAGISEFNGQITFLQVPETPCLNCFIPHKESSKTINVAGATAGVMGSLQCIEAVKYIIGIGENLKNKLLFWDGLSMKFETIAISKNPHCTVCNNI